MTNDMQKIMQDALEEYEFYFDDYETDDSETVLDSLAESLRTKNYQNSPYLNNALSVYYQLAKNSYSDPEDDADRIESQQIMDQIQNYAAQNHFDL